ncbi:hypothetical protein [Mycobacterium xenopi]|uniref:Uncharacterized protein n=1 Tax=Mycobacterium xenopi TaxID=1789 RepID=A0AAD1M180_MYCXE|nr:hypothetical protein [Mycobacterium xenopi]EUA18484.1 putative gp16a [Mycobacterium xenopi 3993]ORX21599.1 hypothetical protein AWC32_21540 [Mycobacterium xenopi]BBU22165.1 hypothetical protein MYXE_19550 [Mycobacterium xenopi]SPX78044.1 Uncharacterised protein [Mycobacterium xenopi]
MAAIIVLEPGTPRTGLWCPKCMLPSGYEVALYGLFESGPRTVAWARRCYDCGAKLPAGDEDRQ